MKVSVIIPYHRGEAYLKDCLDSLKEDAYQDKEIIIISDNVEEKDMAFVEEYQQELDIKMYYLKGKSGVAAARNLGIEQAAGEYIYFLDSDDYLYNDTLDRLVRAATDRDDDITYGKKKPTWFQRSIFLARKQESEAEDTEEEQEDNNSEDAQRQAENDTGRRKRSKNSDSDSADSDDTGDAGEGQESEEDKEGADSFLSSQGEEEEIAEVILTEEELERLRLARIAAAHRILVAKRKGVRNISVLNVLFKRNFIEEHQIRFNEQLVYFSDVPFLVEAISKTEKFRKCLSAKYIKRKHNDAINFPALSQIRDPQRFDEFVAVYYDTIKRIPADSDIRRCFDKKYINYYARTFAPKIKRSSNDIWRNENFLKMSEIIRQINPEQIKALKGYKKRLIKALIKQDVDKSLRIVKVHLGYKKFKKIIFNKSALARTLYIHWFLKRPVKTNYILFESFFGKSYSDSPKYIYQYLSEHEPDKYKCIWVINKRGTKIPYKHTKIKRFSFRYYYYLARSQYFVFNSRQPEWAVKREGTIFLETWHGTPLKKLVFDIDDVASATPRYKQQVYKQSRAWDYLIAPNSFSSETFRRCFMYENEMLDTGYPRNDILHAPNRNEIADKVRDKLGIPKDKKTILYAPTWRDDEFYGKGQYKFELRLQLDYMKEQLGKDYVILLRTHYFIADALDVSGLKGFAYNLSKYDDISELYLISDILITDYSSVFFDYANLKRPMLFYTYDLEKYRDVLRGFYIDIEKEVPGPLLFTTEEVTDAIKNIDSVEKEYKERYEVFYNRFCEWEDGHASEKVVKSVFH